MRNIYGYNEYGVYNIEDVINNFTNIFDMTLPNMTSEFLLTDKKIISKEEIVNYCKNNFNNLNESKCKNSINNSIIDSRLQDYNIFKKTIEIYKEKGLSILNIFVYLNQDKKVKKYEELLSYLDINHYNSIVCGRDIIRLLLALNNIIKNYKEEINKINNLNTYNKINYDSFAILSGRLYPNESLINKENSCDNTSLRLTKGNTKL